jgi:hypothetical protein
MEDLAQERQSGEHVKDLNRARALHQCGVIEGKNPRPHCSSQWMAYQEEVSSCNNLCGPLQFTIICLSAKVNECRGDIGGEDIVQEICRAERSQSSSIPSGQRKIRGDNLHASDQGRRSEDYLLRSQRTLSEWSGRKEDQVSTRSSKDMLIHAQHRWPTAIDACLWPYALRTANEVFNNAQTTT